MTKRNDGAEVSHIYSLFERRRKEARALYEKTFGVSADDPCIDDELEELLRHVAHDFKDTIAVPSRLVAALVLRPRGRGRGRKRPPKERWAKRHEGMAIRGANIRWAELGGGTDARSKAATEAYERTKTELPDARINLKTIRARMRLGKGKRDLEDQRKRDLGDAKLKKTSKSQKVISPT